MCLQGDIVAILDSNKYIVVSYVYDAWGRPISCSGTMAHTLGKINPFRYGWDEHTLEKIFGDIEWVKPGSWSLGD